MQSEIVVKLPDRNSGSRTCPVRVESGLLDRAANHISNLDRRTCLLVCDETVAGLYGQKLAGQLQASGQRVWLYRFPDGESSKSFTELSRLCSLMVNDGIDRNSLVIALGGGVTGDLAGFAASILLRGLPLVQIPTSLLAQVDSSVGGKTGINLQQAKNIVGSFWQPELVMIDPQVLETLDRRQFAAGMAEVIKYGMILDADFLGLLETHADAIHRLDQDRLVKMISRCCELKANVVEADERETTGQRMILNFGHTFGHAIEQVFGYGKYLHGEAVAIGMIWATRFAVSKGFAVSNLHDRLAGLLRTFKLPTELTENLNNGAIDQLLDAMRRDKKVTAGTITLILPEKAGSVIAVPDVSTNELRAFLSNL